MAATRREVLQLCGAAVVAACGHGDREPSTIAPREDPLATPRPTPAIDDGVLDEILEQLHAREPTSTAGLSTHAPMVVEALCALGLQDRAKSWLAGYRGPLLQVPAPHQPIAPDRWREALGPKRGAPTWEAEVHRYGDWRVLFVDELRAERWERVLDRWVARLAPGLASAATHGVIRTAHAARALGRRDTAPRRAELARGLAYWAAAYEELPVTPTAAVPARSALAQVPLYSVHRGGAPGGNIVNGLREVARLPGFGSVRDLLAPAADVGTELSALTAMFARVYLQHGTHAHAIAFVHAVTGPCALRKLAPHVSPATARAALPYAWQTAAAVYAAYAQPGRSIPELRPSRTPAELVARALDNGNDHAIKLTEAALSEHAVRADPAYLAAAEDAVARL